MDILGDMHLFVKVVHNQGLAAAGREMGLSPASMTARIKAMEQRYQVKLLNRTTRSISLTEEGNEFYKDCLRIIDNVTEAEGKLTSSRESLSGPLRVTATSDLGREHIEPLIAEFLNIHPNIKPYLHYSDSITNLTEQHIDVAIRYGQSSEGSLISRKLAASWRVLVVSPEYLKTHGTPKTIQDLKQHKVLGMVQARTPMINWYFQINSEEHSIQISPVRTSNDGAQIHQWALRGYGIAIKSIWDVITDIKQHKLVTLFDEYQPNYQSKAFSRGMDLHAVYPNREYLPQRTRAFIDYLNTYFSRKTIEYFK